MAEYEVIGGQGTDADEILRRRVEQGRVGSVEFDISPAGACPEIFDEMTGLPTFDSIIKSPGKSAAVRVCIDPIDWLRLQMAATLVRQRRVYPQDWLREPINRAENTAELVRLFQSGEGSVPAPVLELDREGSIRSFQEGRNRGVAAYYAGVERMPAWFVVNYSMTDGDAYILNVPSGRRVKEYLDSKEREVMRHV